MAGKDELAAVEDFVSEFGLETFPHLIDEDRSVWPEFDVRSQPAWAFLNDDGALEIFNGRLGAEDLEARLTALIES